MNQAIVEETAPVPTAAAGEPPKDSKKATRSPRRAPVAPTKGKGGKKASPVKQALKTPKGAKKAARTAQPTKSRDGSKATAILELLKRPGGATAKELMKATGWQAHSVGGFLSGTLRKKEGLDVVITKAQGERTYSVKA